MRYLFAATLALSGINAALVLWDMLRAPNPVYLVSLTLLVILALWACLMWKIQRHLYRSLQTLGSSSPPGVLIGSDLLALERWLSILAGMSSLVLLLVLAGIVSRFQEGFPLFG